MPTILVVDDVPTNLRLMAAILTHARHEVIQAADALAGLAQARARQPDLVIADVLMPEVDGFEFVRRLRSDPQLAAIPVIFHTAHYLDEKAKRLAIACGVNHILPKPCAESQLLQVISEALESARGIRIVDPAGDFERSHREVVSSKLLEKVAELEREIEVRRSAEDRVRQLNRVYAVLSGINSLIVRAKTEEELGREACRIVVEQGSFRAAILKLVPDALSAPTTAAAAGRPGDLAAVPADVLEGDAMAAMGTRKPVIRSLGVNVRWEETAGHEAGEGSSAGFVALPLVIGEHAVGCLILVSDDVAVFDDEEMRLLLELAGDVAFALDHIDKADQLNYLAYYDALTGLANRALFVDRMGHNIDDARVRNRELGIVLADLERFESVNEAFGRHTGDQLLRAAAQRLLNAVGDHRLVGRIGADVLGLMVPAARGASIRAVLEEWYADWLGEPFETDQKDVRLSVKSGIALFPDDGEDPETLLRNAEEALRQAKDSGVSVALYAREISQTRAAARAMEAGLKRALDKGEYFLLYQPKVDLESRHLTGVEALLRWRSPELGVVSPVAFIPILEESGLIVEVGGWVAEQAVRDYGRWRNRHVNAPRIAINVSTLQLRRDDFVADFSARLQLPGRDPGIDIEVTETLLLEDAQSNIAKLAALRELGLGIAIDDFGAGYSSLGYLTRLPVQTLKIDRSFISTMLDDPSAMTLVSTMISLAHSLRLTVVAEGVESEEQAKILRLLRCDQMQGYLISHPLTFEDMTTFLRVQR